MSPHLDTGGSQPIELRSAVRFFVLRVVLIKHSQITPAKIVGEDKDDIGLLASQASIEEDDA